MFAFLLPRETCFMYVQQTSPNMYFQQLEQFLLHPIFFTSSISFTSLWPASEPEFFKTGNLPVHLYICNDLVFLQHMGNQNPYLISLPS